VNAGQTTSSVGPVRDADSLAYAEVCRRFLLECPEVRAANELARLEHFVEALAERAEQWRVLRLDVN
jgi:hypothetical protein